MEYASADAMLVDGEWKTYAPDPGTTDAGLSTVVLDTQGVTYSEEATPTIEWTDAPNPLTPQEMAELKPFIRISGHDDYSYSTPPPATSAGTERENSAEDPNLQQQHQHQPQQEQPPQPISASVAPQLVETTTQLIQMGDGKTQGAVEYITTLDGNAVVMDLVPSVVGDTVPSTVITQSYTTVEAGGYAKVNGEEYIQVQNDGTLLNVVSANGYYSANVVKSDVNEEVPAATQGDLMELTAVKLGDFQNGLPTDEKGGGSGLPGDNQAPGYIPISQSQEKSGFKFEWEMPIDKHSVPEVNACVPLPAGESATTACMTLPSSDSTGSIFLPVVATDGINKNYVPVTPEEINRQFGSVAVPAGPVAEPINYSINQQVDPNAPQQQQVQAVVSDTKTDSADVQAQQTVTASSETQVPLPIVVLPTHATQVSTGNPAEPDKADSKQGV